MSSWKKIKIKELSEKIVVGFVGSMSKLFVNEGVPLLRGQNIKPYSLDMDNLKFISRETHLKWKNSVLNAGDVVIVRVGYPGTACVIPQKLGYLNAASLVIIRTKKDELDPHFLTYLLNSPWGKATISGRLVGVAQQVFNTSTAAEMEICIPEIDVQRKIAQILSNYGLLIENNKKRIKLLEKIAKLIYEEWFVNFKFPGHEKIKLIDSETDFGEIPEGWEVDKLRKVASIKKGLGYKGKHLTENGGVCFISLKSLERGGNFRYDGLKRYNGVYKQDHLVITGDIIMAVTDMTQNKEIVGRPARIPNLNEEKMIISMDLVKIIPSEDKNKDWVYSLLRYSNFGIEIKEFANGVNVLHLNPELILDKKIIIPDEDIIERFTKFISGIYKYIDILELKNQNLRKTRDFLLPKFISGDVDVSKLDIKIPEIEA